MGRAPLDLRARLEGSVSRDALGASRRSASAASRRVLLAAALVAASGASAVAAASKDAAPQKSAPAATPAAAPERMVVEARELVYDEDKNTVTARGAAHIYYKGRLLEADRVIYDRKTDRVYAEGNARLTERDGTVLRAERFDLTDDLKTGFIESLNADTAEDTHFSAPRAERTGNDTTIYERATYSACDACKNDPTRPRLWQVQAKRIVHDNVEKMVYYEDAYFELFGQPIAYLPFLSSPDPSVKRKSGFLMPQVSWAQQLGAGVSVPYFWAISPDADLTITPTYFTRQGPFLSGEFRKSFENGSFSIHGDITHVGDGSAFPRPPIGARDKRWRGAVESTGQFDLNDQWKAGWDAAVLSDRTFLQDYRRYNNILSNYFFRESASFAYLTGQGPRSWFDMRSFYFQGLSPSDIQAQQPIVHPVTDYNRAFDIDPKKTFGIGGQVEIDGNFTSTSEQIANYESIQPRTMDQFNGLYNVCQIYAPNPDRRNSTCLLRGIGGDYEHATLSGNWKRKFIDPIGSVWQPFAFARFSGSYLNYNTSDVYPAYNYNTPLPLPIPNAAQSAFVDASSNSFRGQATPGIGVEWRYPILARGPVGDLTIEPIAQLIARPNQTSIPSLVNIDAQSLVFDDSTLFEWSKFSGYDRFETGTRLNYGGQATWRLPNGGSVNAMAGQSRQLVGDNAYSSADAANVGLASGLDTRTSDWVGRLAVSPWSRVSFVAKGRFDPEYFNARRIDLFTNLDLDAVNLSVQYANYASQGPIGFGKRRQGLAANARYDLTKNYFVSGAVTFDMSRYLYNNLTNTPGKNVFAGVTTNGTAPLFSIAALGFGGGYHDECMSLTVNYSQIYQQTSDGVPARNQFVYVTLNLRTLGEAKFNYGLGFIRNQDGVRPSL